MVESVSCLHCAHVGSQWSWWPLFILDREQKCSKSAACFQCLKTSIHCEWTDPWRQKFCAHYHWIKINILYVSWDFGNKFEQIWMRDTASLNINDYTTHPYKMSHSMSFKIFIQNQLQNCIVYHYVIALMLSLSWKHVRFLAVRLRNKAVKWRCMLLLTLPIHFKDSQL